jgi:hypothetical protein
MLKKELRTYSRERSRISRYPRDSFSWQNDFLESDNDLNYYIENASRFSRSRSGESAPRFAEPLPHSRESYPVSRQASRLSEASTLGGSDDFEHLLELYHRSFRPHSGLNHLIDAEIGDFKKQLASKISLAEDERISFFTSARL